MGGKLSFLAGAAVGYVLGARAGQQRYEQIKSRSQQLWHSDPVQAKVSDATDAVKAAAPVVTGKVTEAAKHAGGAAKAKLSSDDGSAASGDGATRSTPSGAKTADNTTPPSHV